ncbi:MAG: hypothetical protein ABEH59_01385 [Halobacteriales archaeon]
MPHRRTLLSAVSLALGAGCLSSDADGAVTDPPSSETVTDVHTASDTPTAGATASGTPALDLREANVINVAFEGAPGEEVRFDVTLFHDDDGEDGYADWWQVESLDGERLGRRELLHAHSTDPFSRSATVAIPAEAGCVVVRGHDQTHGYGGRAMLVNLDSGAKRGLDQGPEPSSLDAEDCP